MSKPKYFDKIAVGIMVLLVFSNAMIVISYESRYELLATQSDSLAGNTTNMTFDYDVLLSRFTALEKNYSQLLQAYNGTLNESEVRFGDGGECTLYVTPQNQVVIDLTQEVLADNYDGDLTLEDIITINNWVASTIEYREDQPFLGKNHSFQYPRETYVELAGDCEDHATLMLSMCKAQENVPCLWCANVGYYRKTVYIWHVCVIVKLGENEYYVFEPMKNIGWHSNASLDIQIAFEQYAEYLGVNAVDVFYIFNENTYRRFETTAEFFSYF